MSFGVESDDEYGEYTAQKGYDNDNEAQGYEASGDVHVVYDQQDKDDNQLEYSEENDCQDRSHSNQDKDEKDENSEEHYHQGMSGLNQGSENRSTSDSDEETDSDTLLEDENDSDSDDENDSDTEDGYDSDSGDESSEKDDCKHKLFSSQWYNKSSDNTDSEDDNTDEEWTDDDEWHKQQEDNADSVDEDLWNSFNTTGLMNIQSFTGCSTQTPTDVHTEDKDSAENQIAKEANKKWLETYSVLSLCDKPFTPPKVAFSCSKPSVHVMHTWDFAYRAARKGPWEQYRVDGERFRKRIQETGTAIEYVFATEHRHMVYNTRFMSSASQ